MDNQEKLRLALNTMAASLAKEDQDAIARIESKCEMDIEKITRTLEVSQLIAQIEKSYTISEAVREHWQVKVLKILASGLFWCGLVGIITILIRPSYVWSGMLLGFVCGTVGRAMERFKVAKD